MGAEIIQDPATAGDFLRRLDKEKILDFLEIKNKIRTRIWERQQASFQREAIINVDSTISATFGEHKMGMDISYNGQLVYHPLVVSLHNTREPLYVINRPGNAPSHLDCAQWIDKSLDLVSGHFKNVQLRGDTDFSLTEHLDKWDNRCTFIFGVDAMANLVKIANEIDETDWEALPKKPKYQVKTRKRRRSENVKRQVAKKMYIQEDTNRGRALLSFCL